MRFYGVTVNLKSIRNVCESYEESFKNGRNLHYEEPENDVQKDLFENLKDMPQYISILFDEEVLQYIVDQTNWYASQKKFNSTQCL